MRIGNNHFIPFKGRRPDLARPVQVYRNINGDALHKYSIKQRGLVVGHTNCMILTNVTLRVSEAGRLRVLKTGRKNVHAFLVGTILVQLDWKKSNWTPKRWPGRVEYDPRKDHYFTDRKGDLLISWARACLLCSKGVYYVEAELE